MMYAVITFNASEIEQYSVTLSGEATCIVGNSGKSDKNTMARNISMLSRDIFPPRPTGKLYKNVLVNGFCYIFYPTTSS